jgi:hypothetical protein
MLLPSSGFDPEVSVLWFSLTLACPYQATTLCSNSENHHFRGHPPGRGPPHYRGFTITLPHSVGVLWTSDQPVPGTCTRQHSQETVIHAPAGFVPAIPTSERPQTHALDRATTGIGLSNNIVPLNSPGVNEYVVTSKMNQWNMKH